MLYKRRSGLLPGVPADSVVFYGGFCEKSSNGWTAAFTEEDSLLTVRVPKEPGLYYFGAYEPYKSLTKDALTEEKRGYSAAQKREALEAALECYKGTVWEDYIRAELDKR